MLKRMGKFSRFAMLFLLIAMGAAVLGIIMLIVFQLQLPAGAVTFIVPMAAGTIVGQWQFQEAEKTPENMALWVDALQFAGIGLLVTLMMSALIVLNPSNSGVVQELGIPLLFGILVGLYLVYVLAIRLGLGIGIKSAQNK